MLLETLLETVAIVLRKRVRVRENMKGQKTNLASMMLKKKRPKLV